MGKRRKHGRPILHSVETVIQHHGVKSNSGDTTSQPQIPQVRQTVDPRTRQQPHLHRMRKAISIIVAVIGTSYSIYVALPSWSLSLPSSSYRPRNPYTAIFTITNAGYLPAANVSVQCVLNDIKYTEPRTENFGFITEVNGLGVVKRNESRTFSCPQALYHLEMQATPYAPTQDQVTAYYREHILPHLGPKGEWQGEDMPFEWADFEFHVIYSPAFLPLKFISKYRVVGRPGQYGTFVWEQVALDKKF
jgi:hypothetical protein